MPLKLSVVTPEGEWSHAAVESVVLPGAEGDFGVLPSHERFLTALRIGQVQIRTGQDERLGAISDGFAVVDGDEVVVMVEASEFADEIDVPRARLAAERAERELSALRGEDDAERYAEFEAALSRARNRLKVSEQAGS